MSEDTDGGGWGGVNYAAELTHRRSNERTREPGLHTAAGSSGPFFAAGSTGSASEWQTSLTVLSAACIHPGSSKCLDAQQTRWLNGMAGRGRAA